jgi:hypothetical protein
VSDSLNHAAVAQKRSAQRFAEQVEPAGKAGRGHAAVHRVGSVHDLIAPERHDLARLLAAGLVDVAHDPTLGRFATDSQHGDKAGGGQATALGSTARYDFLQGYGKGDMSQ